MTPIPLIQAIKEFKEKQARVVCGSDPVAQAVSWDLDPAFVGEPINASTISRLSEYVDRRLEEYSSIYGTMPAVRSQIGSSTAHLSSIETPIGLVLRPSSDSTDDHVAHSSERHEDHFIRFNPTSHAEESSDVNDEVMRNCVRAAREEGVPAGAIYSDGQVDYPDENECLPDHQLNVVDPYGGVVGNPQWVCSEINVKRLQDSSVEGFRLKTTPAVETDDNDQEDLATRNICLSSPSEDIYGRSWMNGGDLDALVYSQGALPSSRNRGQDTFIRPVPGINPECGPLNEDTLGRSDLQEMETMDSREVSNSVLRTQDGREINNDPMRPIHIKPLHVSMNPMRTPWPWPRNTAIDTTSYVTSYNIDHVLLKISARILTVPSSMKVESNLWFDLCSEPKNLRDVIRTTMKTNLAIRVSESRGSGWKKDEGEAEEIALNTLREMITEEEFRKYIKYGFVAVRGKSGSIYQIFRNRPHTKVWVGNRIVEEICVRINYKLKAPPTDNVIAFMTMVQADEGAFKKAGNVYKSVGGP